jgi:hypothetical protein
MKPGPDRMSTDILITGTGMFAGRIALDIAATAKTPVSVVVAGRNSDRLDWLRTAGNARAAMFGTPARIASHRIDLLAPDACAELLKAYRPRIVVQAASIQTSAVIADKGSRWSDLVREGGLSATAVFQCFISRRMAAAIAGEAPGTAFINCSFPDVVNGMIAAMGYEVLCGTGNVAILSNIFQGCPGRPDGDLRVLAQYQCLAPWRRPAAERSGAPPPRVFIGDAEVPDVFKTFASCRLTPEPAIEVSGASGVTLMLAMIAGTPWRGHVPGPAGLPGGYPVEVAGNRIDLDLPAGIKEAEAIAWNDAFEQKKGLTVKGRRASFNGRLAELLAAERFAYAEGFEVDDLEEVCRDMLDLRDKLLAAPPAG